MLRGDLLAQRPNSVLDVRARALVAFDGGLPKVARIVGRAAPKCADHPFVLRASFLVFDDVVGDRVDDRKRVECAPLGLEVERLVAEGKTAAAMTIRR